MKRDQIITEIWKYGFKNPSFQIEELKNYLKDKVEKEDDMNFGLAYVRRCFLKNEYLNEYLIDPDSISNHISHRQWRISVVTVIVSIVFSIFTLYYSARSYYKDTSNPLQSAEAAESERITTADTSEKKQTVPIPNVIIMDTNAESSDIETSNIFCHEDTVSKSR